MNEQPAPARRAPLRFLLAAVGTRGDVQPMLGLAQAIGDLGHTAVVAAPPEFREWVESHGLAFASIGINVRHFLDANPGMLGGSPRGALRAWLNFWEDLPLQASELKAACAGVDAVAWGGLALSAPSIGEHLKLPVLGVVYSTSLVPSRMHPPVAFPWQTLPSWVNRLLWLANRGFARFMMAPGLNGVRAALGLPAVSLYDHLFRQARYVIATDEHLFPTDPGWGDHFQRANYVFYDDPLPLDAELSAWLDAGEPPVFVDFGSMPLAHLERAAGAIRQALVASGHRCLVGGALAAAVGDELPAEWRVIGAAPHARLFPRLAAVLHHGGSGTVANALRAGVPQVVLPLILDQYQHAHRLHQAGITPAPVPLERIGAAQLTQALSEALALPPGPRQQAAARLRASDGRGEIARILERMVTAQAAPAARPAGPALTAVLHAPTT